jgi:hypothetical protein
LYLPEISGATQTSKSDEFVDIGGIGPSLSFYCRNIFLVMHILFSTSSNIIPLSTKYI